MMTLEWRYRALVLRLLLAILNRVCVGGFRNHEEDTLTDARAMIDEFRRNA